MTDTRARRDDRRVVPRRLAGALLFVLLIAGLARPAWAQRPVDTAIVLAVDASGSVDQERFTLQKHGYAAAFRSPDVLRAIGSGSRGAIAVTMMQWTGPSLHQQVVGWQVITDAASAIAFADAIDAAPRALHGGGTSLSGAIEYGGTLFANTEFRAERSVIDISGDGANNAGRAPNAARDAAVRRGLVINGLPILTLEPNLDKYYEQNVIGGPGAFVVAVRSYDDFAAAVLKKLVLEIAEGPSLRRG